MLRSSSAQSHEESHVETPIIPTPDDEAHDTPAENFSPLISSVATTNGCRSREQQLDVWRKLLFRHIAQAIEFAAVDRREGSAVVAIYRTIEEAERRGLPTEDPGDRKSSGFSAEHTAIAASRAVVEAVCYSRQKTANIAIIDRTEASTPLLRVLDSAQRPGKTFERDVEIVDEVLIPYALARKRFQQALPIGATSRPPIRSAKRGRRDRAA